MIVYVCAFHKGWCNILLFSDVVEIIGCSDETDEFVAMIAASNYQIFATEISSYKISRLQSIHHHRSWHC